MLTKRSDHGGGSISRLERRGSATGTVQGDVAGGVLSIRDGEAV
ncbi:hypothetical protein GFS60_06916 (plasmid) [Rhodococcus sp. WAY2]|nr:hypothetical protein GFS60_06916 [Rhodococcus sp. WAY2]